MAMNFAEQVGGGLQQHITSLPTRAYRTFSTVMNPNFLPHVKSLAGTVYFPFRHPVKFFRAVAVARTSITMAREEAFRETAKKRLHSTTFRSIAQKYIASNLATELERNRGLGIDALKDALAKRGIGVIEDAATGELSYYKSARRNILGDTILPYDKEVDFLFTAKELNDPTTSVRVDASRFGIFAAGIDRVTDGHVFKCTDIAEKASLAMEETQQAIEAAGDEPLTISNGALGVTELPPFDYFKNSLAEKGVGVYESSRGTLVYYEAPIVERWADGTSHALPHDNATGNMAIGEEKLKTWHVDVSLDTLAKADIDVSKAAYPVDNSPAAYYQQGKIPVAERAMQDIQAALVDQSSAVAQSEKKIEDWRMAHSDETKPTLDEMQDVASIENTLLDAENKLKRLQDLDVSTRNQLAVDVDTYRSTTSVGQAAPASQLQEEAKAMKTSSRGANVPHEKSAPSLDKTIPTDR